MGHSKVHVLKLAFVIILIACAVECVTAPVKTSDYPWINTNAIEYLQPTDAVAVLDAQHFDSALSPERFSKVKTERPGKLCLKYQIWRDTYVNEWAAFERQKQETWARNNGKNAEDFWCHYANDVTVSLSTGKKVIPGWNPANDANRDDIRDYKSDYGTATAVGTGYLQDTTKNWVPNEWAGHILVDRLGNQFTIISNTATQINVSGTPASGRYGLSHVNSADHKATARTRAEARVRVHAWGDASYPDAWVQNYSSQDYWAYRRYDVQQLIVEGNTSWDPGADTRWDGIFVDSTLPYYDWPTVVDGQDRVLEYPNRDPAIYKQHTINLIAYVKAGIGNKLICPNTCGLFPEAGDAGGAVYEENTISFTGAQGPSKWEQWRTRNAKGVYCFTGYFFSYSDRAREQIHFLAHHYIAQEPYIYFGIYGFGYTPVQWFAAMEKDVGTPTEPYSVWKSGTDPVGQSYVIYKRQYTKALILCRPMNPAGQSNFGDASRVTFALPSYTTADGGTSNRYYGLRADGTLSEAITSIGLRNVESAILFPADTASQPQTDTTPPVISGVSVTNIGPNSATITWTTNENATSVVEYGTTTSYGTTISNETVLSTSHNITLTGLQPSTTYHYRVQSKDSAGNNAVSADYTFTTSADVTATAPFIRSWLVLGPFNNTNRDGYNLSLIGETSVSPTSGDVAGGLTWTPHQSTSDLIDFASIFNPNIDTVAYAHIYVKSPSAQNCQLWLGSDDGIKVWINGTLVHDNFAYRPAVKDQDKVSISFQAGWNRMLIKVDQVAGGWGFYARICDSNGKEIPGLEYALDNPQSPPPDTTPPAISAVSATITSFNQATITWKTDEPSTSVVEYGPTAAYGSNVSDTTLATQHSIILTGLMPGTTYHYRVKSADASGNLAVSADLVFITPTPPDTTPPTISGISAQSGATDATISWQTDEAATSTVEYGTSTLYGYETTDSTLVTQHTVRLTSLSPDTLYHYRVCSTDASGNEAVSKDYTFATLPMTTTGPASYIREWLVIGPFNNTNRAGLSTDYIGEATITPSTNNISNGLTWWAYKSPIDVIDLSAILYPTDYSVAYAHLYINSPSEQACELRLGSDDGVKVWLNGTLIHENAAWRPVIKDQDKVPITLKQGWNQLLIKVDNLTAGWGFAARICNTAGNEVPGLVYQLDNPVPKDMTPPRVVSAKAIDRYTIIVYFDEPVTAETANVVTNYSTTAKVKLQSANLQADGKSVLLKTTRHYRGTYTLRVINVSDLAGNKIPSVGAINNTATYTVY
ncbi:MAG: fibronectin type III domain-containing protein [Armatimonadetes bacterium]|nr:fibronectin type III domain-containing protein [Armatimonadota bacterium]